jgi:hypothetical protein
LGVVLCQVNFREFWRKLSRIASRFVMNNHD